MKQYTPNFDDPRVSARCKTALGFVIGVLSETKSHQWSTRYIDKHLGQQQTKLGKYLRESLLICDSDKYYFNGDQHKCKEYRRNAEGIEHLKDHIAHVLPAKTIKTLTTNWEDPIRDNHLVAYLVEREYGDQLRSGDFDYRESSHRLWNNLQNVRSVYRKPLLSEYGYSHNYDIEACAPNIIEQLSRRYGNDLYMPALDDYICNKTEFRKQISKDFELDAKTTKVFLNSLFCGAIVGENSRFATSILLSNDVAKIVLAKEHATITQLRADIKLCWSHIVDSNQEISRRRKIETNHLCPVNSRERWGVYFKYEREVISSISRYLRELNIKCFLEHDGFSSNQLVDVVELCSRVKLDTGFDLKIEYNEY